METKIKMNWIGFLAVIIYSGMLWSLIDLYGEPSSAEKFTYGFWEILKIGLFIALMFCLGKYSKYEFE